MASYDVNQKPGESLEKYYRRLAKTADQRLVRLEKLAKEPNYEPAELWAYRRAKIDITKWNRGTPPDKYRFNVAPPKDPEQLMAKINDIKGFITRPTSTKQGITNVYKKRADTLNSKFGTNFTWQQMAKYYSSGKADLWDKKFGSKTALRTIGAIQKHKDKIKAAVEAADIAHLTLPDEKKIIVQRVKRALKDNKLNWEELV